MSLPGSLVGWLNAQFTDDEGVPLAGGFVQAYAASTTTPKDTFADAQYDAANENPIELDAAGRADIFLLPGGYDFIVYNAEMEEQYSKSGVEDIGQTFLSGLGTTFSEGSKDVETGYEVLPTDQLVTVSSGEVTDPCVVQLPPASDRTSDDDGNGLPLWVKNFAAVDLAVTPNGADTIDGALGPYTVPAASAPLFPCVQLVSDGVSAWYVIGAVGV